MNFIEVTGYDNGKTLLVNVDNITTVIPWTNIKVGNRRESYSCIHSLRGEVFVKETVEELKQKIYYSIDNTTLKVSVVN